MVKLKEIRIQNVKYSDRPVIKKLYDEVLYKDNHWHFFFEGDFSVIRCMKKSVGKSSKILKKEGFEIEVVDYNEDQEITQRFIEEFIGIFHGYSVIAIGKYDYEENKSDFLTLFHRIVHCFLNPIASIELIKDFTEKEYSNHKNYSSWESHALTEMAISHSFSRGYMKGVDDEKIGDD